jgi:hypothetical protein
MNTVHDPFRQIGFLQQCFSSNKKPLGLFLGAGCPMSIPDGAGPLIPDIAGVTRIVRESLSKCTTCGPLLATIEDQFKQDGRETTTVEDILTQIRSLRTVAGKGEVRGISAENLDTLDERICQTISEMADKPLPNQTSPYHRVASWVDAVGRDKPVELFTTNYDLLMEQAFEDCRVPYFDGFAGAHKPSFDIRAMEEDTLPARWARLWKLHGSINWFQRRKKGVFRASPNEKGSKRVIHPSHLKYEESRRLPYLAMIDRLRAFLKQPTATLVLCGYSFQDQHLNEAIMQGLQSTQTAIAFALLFKKLEEYPAAVELARERSNFTLLARDAAVISGNQLSWPTRPTETDKPERHGWINWVPLPPVNGKFMLSAEFVLGNFAEFGEFLRQLAGESRQRWELENVD